MTGVKIAELMHAAGVKCGLADLAGWILPTAALEPVGRRIMARLAEMGLTLHFGLTLERIIHHGNSLTACFKGGEEIEADLLGLCLGVRSRVALAREAGLAVGRGITVDRAMRSSAPGVYAAGDCCEAVEIQSGARMVIGLWANAGQQGRTAGENMVSGTWEAAPAWRQPEALQNISRFFNMDFISFGDVNRGDPEKLIFENRDYYIAAAQESGRLSCLNMLGPPHGGGILKNMMFKAFSGLRDNPPEQLGLLAQYGLPGDFLAWLDRAGY
jgi:NADPH-dependent 2,4-dienoyl-CoA reductase/sulfur reductase-like enzyme